MNALFYAHSGLRYLVLLAGIVAILYHAYGLFSSRPVDRPARITGSAFVGLLDLQIVLGLILMMAGIFYGALMGHMVMMILAAVAAHVGGLLARRSVEPRGYYTARLSGLTIAMVLVYLGVAAIGRPLFSSGAPSVMS